VPHHPLCRYCSEACRHAARCWSRWLANQKYRAPPAGEQCRREQSRRRRKRQRERLSADANKACVGYHKDDEGKKFCCHRPGCYERYNRTARSPRKKFCSAACRMALRRVLVREARWAKRRKE
jgi:hypothetical protein